MDDQRELHARLERALDDLSQARSTIPRDVEQIERLKREAATLEAALSVEPSSAQPAPVTDWPMWHEGSAQLAPVKHARLAVVGLVIACVLIGAALVVLFDHISRRLQ